jgi:glycosyl transferase, family 25
MGTVRQPQSSQEISAAKAKESNQRVNALQQRCETPSIGKGTSSTMRAYVINLARSTDRRAHIVAELKKTNLNYEIVTGIDGRELDLSDRTIADPSVISYNRLPAGAVGCALSHLEAYQRIISDGADRALILEDDVNLPADIGSVIDAVAEHLTGAEVALLNYHTDDVCQLSSTEAVSLPSSRMLALPIDVTQLTSTGAYVITRSACERMTKSMPPIRANADDWQFFYKEEILDRIRGVWPPVVIKNAKLDSTIGSYSLANTADLKARLLGPLVRRNIPILHQLIIYRRHRIFRKRNQSKIVDGIPFINKPCRIDR